MPACNIVFPARRSKNHGRVMEAGSQMVAPRGDGRQTVLWHGLSCKAQQKPWAGHGGRVTNGGDGRQTVLWHGLSCKAQQKPWAGHGGRVTNGRATWGWQTSRSMAWSFLQGAAKTMGGSWRQGHKWVPHHWLLEVASVFSCSACFF